MSFRSFCGFNRRFQVYSYAIGLFESRDIENQISRDPRLLELAPEATPCAGELRRFRRYHRPLPQHTLACVLQLAWRAELESASPQLGTDSEAERHFERTAETRLTQAALRDMMALDC